MIRFDEELQRHVVDGGPGSGIRGHRSARVGGGASVKGQPSSRFGQEKLKMGTMSSKNRARGERAAVAAYASARHSGKSHQEAHHAAYHASKNFHGSMFVAGEHAKHAATLFRDGGPGSDSGASIPAA